MCDSLTAFAQNSFCQANLHFVNPSLLIQCEDSPDLVQYTSYGLVRTKRNKTMTMVRIPTYKIYKNIFTPRTFKNVFPHLAPKLLSFQ